ncbi:MAG TPA: hypothetical protein VKA38_00755 [Draconibacterium sp.]|nr:hypothetical protein [Draconibacterium sp.]
MKNNEIKKLKELLNNEKTQEAKQFLELIPPENSSEYWLFKGQIEQKFQNWSNALNAFKKVLEIAPNNREAKNNIGIIQDILNFWNPEMFNP